MSEANVRENLERFGLGGAQIRLMREKKGVWLYRVRTGRERFVLKYFEHEWDRREIFAYQLLNRIGVSTPALFAQSRDAILIEDLARSETWRLAILEDLYHPELAQTLAGWYRKLHEGGREAVAELGANPHDESDVVTEQNLRHIRSRADIATPRFADLIECADALRAAAKALAHTLSYNDFFYTNMAVSHDHAEVMMFDYNMMGSGYVYADLRNVTVSLSEEAGAAFLNAYGAHDAWERAVDQVIAPLITLHAGCQAASLPYWCANSIRAMEDERYWDNVKSVLERIDCARA